MKYIPSMIPYRTEGPSYLELYGGSRISGEDIGTAVGKTLTGILNLGAKTIKGIGKGVISTAKGLGEIVNTGVEIHQTLAPEIAASKIPLPKAPQKPKVPKAYYQNGKKCVKITGDETPQFFKDNEIYKDNGVKKISKDIISSYIKNRESYRRQMTSYTQKTKNALEKRKEIKNIFGKKKEEEKDIVTKVLNNYGIKDFSELFGKKDQDNQKEIIKNIQLAMQLELYKMQMNQYK